MFTIEEFLRISNQMRDYYAKKIKDSFQEFKINEAPSRAKRLVKHQDIVYSTVRPIQRHFGFIENPNFILHEEIELPLSILFKSAEINKIKINRQLFQLQYPAFPFIFTLRLI